MWVDGETQKNIIIYSDIIIITIIMIKNNNINMDIIIIMWVDGETQNNQC